jgi:hypothetical protein
MDRDSQGGSQFSHVYIGAARMHSAVLPEYSAVWFLWTIRPFLIFLSFLYFQHPGNGRGEEIRSRL